ncbi:hypothetical protein F4780DRAFT_444499 [Xylariomycetidae sp. FL0641]|nr:hypothetical protein F4780DRAFT_444499 [Xylariomycetidae sp. FL0641]
MSPRLASLHLLEIPSQDTPRAALPSVAMNEAENVPAVQFLPFPRLPPELRRQIWALSLPSNLVDFDTAIPLCRAPDVVTWRKPVGPPPTAHACHEARCVALESGGMRVLEHPNRPTLRASWFDTRRDFMCLNSGDMRNIAHKGRIADQERGEDQSVTTSWRLLRATENVVLRGTSPSLIWYLIPPLAPCVKTILFYSGLVSFDPDRPLSKAASDELFGPDPSRAFLLTDLDDQGAVDRVARILHSEANNSSELWYEIVARVRRERPPYSPIRFSNWDEIHQHARMRWCRKLARWSPLTCTSLSRADGQLDLEHPWVQSTSAAMPDIRRVVCFRAPDLRGLRRLRVGRVIPGNGLPHPRSLRLNCGDIRPAYHGSAPYLTRAYPTAIRPA